MDERQVVRFGILEYDPAESEAQTWVLAAARRRDDPGICWLPSGSPGLTTRLEQTLGFLGSEWTVDSPDMLSIQRELKSRGIDNPTSASFLLASAMGNRPLTGGHWRPGQAVVLGIGSEGGLQACRFAALTGRPVRLLSNFEQLPEALQPLAAASSLLIASGPELNSELVRALDDALDETGLDLPVGWLYPFGTLERDYAMLKCVIFGRTRAVRPLPLHFMFPLEPAAELRATHGDRWVFGPSLKADDAVDLLQRPAEFLAVTGHSNGIDMGVGHAVLCPRSAPMSDSPCRALPCFHGADCSRKSASNALCQVSSMRSIVTVLYTCWGAVLDRHTFDVRSSLLFELAKSPASAAVITTYASTLMDASASIELARQYAQQTALGEAVRSVNADHCGRYNDAPPRALMLFGDPEHRGTHLRPLLDDELRKAEPIARLLRRRQLGRNQDRFQAETQRSHEREISKRILALEHLRLVATSHRALSLEAIMPPLARIGAVLDRLWLWQTRHLLRSRQYGAAASGSPGAPYARELEQVQSGFLDFFSAMVSHLGGSLHLQTDGLFSDTGPSAKPKRVTCPYCGSRSKRLIQPLVTDERIRRQIQKCDNCAVIQEGDAFVSQVRMDTFRPWSREHSASVELLVQLEAGLPEPPRVLRRLQPLRGWSYEEVEQVLA